MKPTQSERPTPRRLLARRLTFVMAAGCSLVLSGCRSFNYTEADLERERRLLFDAGRNTPFGWMQSYGDRTYQVERGPASHVAPAGRDR